MSSCPGQRPRFQIQSLKLVLAGERGADRTAGQVSVRREWGRQASRGGAGRRGDRRGLKVQEAPVTDNRIITGK